MNATFIHKTIVLFLILSLSSCSSEKKRNHEYKVINTFLDSLVKQSRRDSIGLSLTTLNHILSEELVLHDGFMMYEDGKFSNKCPENNIKTKKFSKFDYKSFKSDRKTFDASQISNNHITTHFTLKTQYYKDRMTSFTTHDPTLNKQDLLEMLWKSEHGQVIYQVSSPIFSDDGNTVVVFVRAVDFGLQSWTLKKGENNKWIIFCTEQITT